MRTAEKFETNFKIRRSHGIEKSIVGKGQKYRSVRPDIESFVLHDKVVIVTQIINISYA